MKTLFAVVLAAISACVSSGGHAAVLYEFEITSPYDVSFYSPQGTVAGKFTYKNADFIDLGSPELQFAPPADLASCEATSSQGAVTCAYAFFQRSYLTSPLLHFNQVQLAISGGGNVTGVNAYFADGAFTSPGTHLAINDILTGPEAKLVVTVLGGAVPEPGTWAMMIGGFALIGAGLRRRAARLSVRRG